MDVYLDNNATTPVDPEVLAEMMPFLQGTFGNASSIHSVGQKARAAVEEARDRVAALIGAEARDIVFTCGGTEADNAGIAGVARARRDRGRHIITTRIEHHAVLRMCESLEEEGFEVTYLDVDESGRISIDELEAALRDDTILASIMYANNETGVLQPLKEAAEMIRARGALLHSDAVQAVGKIAVDVEDLGVDLLSMSAHKLHGPKGVGALFVRSGIPWLPFLLGGGHERNRRGGTENVPGIVGLGKACENAGRSLEFMSREIRDLRDRLETTLLEQVPRIVVNGAGVPRLPHVSNLSFCGLQGESLLVAMDFEGISVSTGAACASGSVSPSHVLVAMGLTTERVQGAIRFSLGRFTRPQEIEYALHVVPRLVAGMSAATGVR